ncbi:MAG: ribonuclease Z [Lachnospiraceae bacterium]|nr:ribonuclease Z [Lachnospiraceae bacterium]
MILIQCVDDEMGTSFGGKRQSRDREVTRDILRLASDSVLRTDAYTGKLLLADKEFFSADTVSPENILVSDDCLEVADPGEYCFVELMDVSSCMDRVEEIVLYHWNRAYPSTEKFTMPDGYALSVTEEFAGYSHEKITKEVYIK